MRSGFDHKWHLSLFAQILTCSLNDPSCEKVENIVADSKRLSAQHKHQCRLVTMDHRVGKRYQLRRALRRFHISFHTLEEERTEEAIRGVVCAHKTFASQRLHATSAVHGIVKSLVCPTWAAHELTSSDVGPLLRASADKVCISMRPWFPWVT